MIWKGNSHSRNHIQGSVNDRLGRKHCRLATPDSIGFDGFVFMNGSGLVLLVCCEYLAIGSDDMQSSCKNHGFVG